MAHRHTSEHTKADQGHVLDRLHATLSYDEAITAVNGISAQRAGVLRRAMHISTVRDLLRTYPHRYIDMSALESIQHAQIAQQCTIVGVIHEIRQKRPRPQLNLVEISLVDDTGLLMVTCFNQPWLMNTLAKGARISVSGKVEFNYGFKRMTNPLIVVHDPGEEASGIVLPVHPSTAKLSRALMRRFIHNALDMVRGMHDPLPLALRSRYRLYSRYQALRGVHEPHSLDDAERARRRLRYEELFFLELELIEHERQRVAGVHPFAHSIEGEQVQALRAVLPFALTEDQESALDDIFGKMAEPHPMNHLLLGDVGTGKTVVAAFAIAAAIDSGNQAFMMGPTEVLVRQYGRSLGSLFDAVGISWAIMTGSTPASDRADVLARFSVGDISVLMGTHALLENDVVAQRASLVCIDEQQRFGVEQRDALIAKAPGADILSMTATPIPRSLALALYGGLTLSYLHHAPALQGGRSTKVYHFSEEGVAYDALRAALERGEQAYVICPLIGLDLSSDAEEDAVDDSHSHIEYAAIEWDIEHDDVGDTLAAATLHAKILQEQVVPQARVELLHGRMSASEKAAVMDAFHKGDVDVLVSTTVVEVGVDVPNATVMIIEDADRFGLAQLHQLRGRVGRGSLPGSVFLVSRSRAPQSLERLRIMEQTEDGFALSEKDLTLRREGDIFGDRQHGRSPLALVNVVRDKAMIEAAYADARQCFEEGFLNDDERALIKRELTLVQKARKS
ncbi:MAG: ATP-dependent DNA helicase RecG [Eggerthellaceae bacterium]